MSDVNNALRVTAYHEAGHAVIRLALGLTVTTVSIIPSGDSNGRCQSPGALGYRSSNGSQRRAIGRAIIVACYAGLEAERLVDPDAPEDHGSGDQAAAFEQSRLLEVFPRHFSHVGDEAHWAYLGTLRQEARRRVRQNRTAIAALAEALQLHRELDGRQVEGLVGHLVVS